MIFSIVKIGFIFVNIKVGMSRDEKKNSILSNLGNKNQ